MKFPAVLFGLSAALPELSHAPADYSKIAYWLNSNKGTKSDIEIAPAERALDRFSSCFFEPVVQRSAPVVW